METISRYLLTILLNATWQIPLLAAVAALAARLMRNGPASHRHIVWVAALAAAVFLPLASVGTLQQDPGLDIIVQYAPQSLTPAPLVPPAYSLIRSTPPPPSRTVDFPRTAATALLAAYALFLLFRSGKLALAWRRTTQIRHGAQHPAIPPAMEAAWAHCLKVFGLHGVELLSSKDIHGPVTAGATRKTVILPEALFTETSEEVLLTAIGHEMAHIARRDYALSLLYELLFLPVSFHPAAWILRRGIERSREIACDEMVVQRLLDAGVYARSIVSIAATMTGLPRSGNALGVFDGDILEERIRRLVDRPANWKHARALLATGLSALALCTAIVSGLALKARAQGGDGDEMKLAGSAYNAGDFHTAVLHFQNAVKLAPASLDAKMFLANALMRQFFVEKAPPNSPLLASARRQYSDVLATEPQNKQALRGMIAVAMQSKNLIESRDWATKLIQLDATDKSAYYTAGLLDWAIVYPEFQRAKDTAGGRMEDYAIPDAALRKVVRDRHLSRVEDGFRMLQTAIQLDANYDDAMAYLNLLYRLKAGLVDSPAESADLIAKADEWVGKAIAIKRKGSRGEAPTAARLNVDGPPPGPPSPTAMVAAPPPPPPPPPGPTVREDQLASANPPSRPRSAAEQPGSFWQVLGSSDIPANMLVRLLRAKGFAAALHRTQEETIVRVMAGPYFDQSALERAKDALAAAGFRPLRTW